MFVCVARYGPAVVSMLRQASAAWLLQRMGMDNLDEVTPKSRLTQLRKREGGRKGWGK